MDSLLDRRRNKGGSCSRQTFRRLTGPRGGGGTPAWQLLWLCSSGGHFPGSERFLLEHLSWFGTRHLQRDDLVSVCFPLCISFLGLPNKVPQTEQLKPQKFIVSQFWRQEDQDPGVGRVGSSEGCEGEVVPASPLTSDAFLAVFGVPGLVEALPQFLPSSSHGVIPVCMPLCLISPFYKGIVDYSPP